MDEYLVIPNTGERIQDGSLVILDRLPNIEWVVHFGFYSYNGHKESGWYLSSVPSQTIMPLFQTDLYMIKVIDKSFPCPPFPPFPPCPPIPPCPPCPPGPGPGPEVVPFTKEDKLNIDRAMITVPDAEARDKLSSEDLIDGKIVRVNDYQGEVGYFEWNSEASEWRKLDICRTIDELADRIDDLQAQIDEIPEWIYLN